MRRAGTLLALTMAAVVLATAVRAGASASVQQRRVEAVRVCGAAALDRRAGECRKDESSKPLRSSIFNCSARAQAGAEGERFAGRLLFRGQPFPAYGTNVSGRRKGVYVFLTAGPNPMPGGPWACELRVGPELVRKSFRSSGPTAPILYVAACPSSRTVLAGAVRVCRRDESGTPFSSTESVSCSAVFAGGMGKLVTIAFLREGKEVFSGDFELPLPVTAAGPRLDPDPRLQPGKWACQWTLAGRVLAVKHFSIG